MNAPFRLSLLQMACLACLAGPALAQPIIPNPLVRPVTAAAAAASAASVPLPAAAPARRGERPGSSPDEAGQPGEPPSIPLAIQERVSGLYVAAIVGKAAVLRSQMAVAQVVFSNGPGSAGGGGAAASTQGSGTGSTAPRPGGGPGESAARGVFRAASYVVRNGQVVDFIDRYKVLARVTADTVVLYLLPPDTGDERHAKVVFRGSIDSVIASPPVPLASSLEAPDGGLDGKAWRALSDVATRGFGAGSRTDGAAQPASQRPSVSGR
jgi:hypothetical protein